MTLSMTSTIKEFIYAINMPDSEYIRIHDVFIHKMLSYTFYEPNMLGFSKNPEEALWLILPMSSINNGKKVFDNIYCIWRNGHWYYWSMAWID